MRSFVIALAALCASGAAFAQPRAPAPAQAPAVAEDGIGPYHFGMDEAALRATAPNATWTATPNSDGSVVLTGGPRIALGESRLTAALVVANGALTRILFLGGSTASCAVAVQTILADLEPDYGPFAAAPAPWDIGGDVTDVTRTEGGSEIRTKVSTETSQTSVAATRAGAMFMQVQGQISTGEANCHVSVMLTPGTVLARNSADAALWTQIDHAQTLLHPSWEAVPSGDAYTQAYPHAALESGASGGAVLDCIVASDGSLRCAVAAEQPPGIGFGAAGVQIARDYRIRTDTAGASVIGKRYRLEMSFLTNQQNH